MENIENVYNLYSFTIMIIHMANQSDTSNNFAVIFDGNNLTNWQMAGRGKFLVLQEEGALQSEGGMGLLWYTEKIYLNFILELDWKVHHKADNSGVFVRFPYPDNDPMIAVNNGYEIQIDDLAKPDGNPIHQTGAIYGYAAASKQIVSKEAGRWNIFKIHVTGQKYTVILNNKIVTEFVGNRSLQGYIGLQNHDSKSKVSFRNIRIKEI
jgi:3-keto-disaccharide hydrolase